MQFSEMGDMFIKNSDESLQQFVDYGTLMYLASMRQFFLLNLTLMKIPHLLTFCD